MDKTHKRAKTPVNASHVSAAGFLTTGEAARLCSVTPDAMLKWIKAGRVPARRTGGGHFRIPADALEPFVTSAGSRSAIQPGGEVFGFCWEFSARRGVINPACRHCLTYRIRAQRCFELAKLPEIAQHLAFICSADCDNCEYHRANEDDRPSVIVASDRPEVLQDLESHKANADFRMNTADCEYQLAVLMGAIHPDFVVIDCSMGIGRAKKIVRQLLDDVRVPFIRVIMAGERDDFPRECDRELFAFIHRPVTVKALNTLIERCREADSSLVAVH